MSFGPFSYTKSASEAWADAKSVILEHGVELVRETTSDDWKLTTRRDGFMKESPQAFCEKYRLKPILVTIRKEVLGFPEAVLIASASGSEFIDAKLTRYSMGAWSSRQSPLEDLFRIRFAIECAHYHCRRLAIRYQDTLHRIAGHGIEREFPSALKLTLMQKEHYFDFEALLASVIRASDLLRIPIWKYWGHPTDLPSSFRKLVASLKQSSLSSPAISNAIRAYWESLGLLAKEHRDCIEHYASIGAMQNVEVLSEPDRPRIVRVLIPDNPEARSSSKFRYDTYTDALTFGWRLTDAISQLAFAIIEEAEKMHPPR